MIPEAITPHAALTTPLPEQLAGEHLALVVVAPTNEWLHAHTVRVKVIEATVTMIPEAITPRAALTTQLPDRNDVLVRAVVVADSTRTTLLPCALSALLARATKTTSIRTTSATTARANTSLPRVFVVTSPPVQPMPPHTQLSVRTAQFLRFLSLATLFLMRRLPQRQLTAVLVHRSVFAATL